MILQPVLKVTAVTIELSYTELLSVSEGLDKVLSKVYDKELGLTNVLLEPEEATLTELNRSLHALVRRDASW